MRESAKWRRIWAGARATRSSQCTSSRASGPGKAQVGMVGAVGPHAVVEAVEQLGQHRPVVAAAHRGGAGRRTPRRSGRGPLGQAEQVIRVVQAAQRMEHEHACGRVRDDPRRVLHADHPVEVAEVERGERLVPVRSGRRGVDSSTGSFTSSQSCGVSSLMARARPSTARSAPPRVNGTGDGARMATFMPAPGPAASRSSASAFAQVSGRRPGPAVGSELGGEVRVGDEPLDRRRRSPARSARRRDRGPRRRRARPARRRRVQTTTGRPWRMASIAVRP